MTEASPLLATLPSGTTVVNASAGTGKTFTLAALATRFIAEADVSASQLLMVTFTRAATAELRSRVRSRISEAAAYLRSDPSASPSADPFLVSLAAVDEAERGIRADRLERAVAEFDSAMITTIHGFATQVMGALGVASVLDPDSVLVDDSRDLALECCSDVLASASTLHPPEELPPVFSTFVSTVRTAANLGGVRLEPGAGADADPAAERYAELVGASLELMRRRRRQRTTMSFDEVLSVLDEALASESGRATLETLRSRFRVALIDEFQDTDPVQWSVFGRLFGDAVGDAPTGPLALVLVGDPKQAIYSFRGADIETYLLAIGGATDTYSLGTNWRSDPSMLAATEVLLSGTTYGSDDIRFDPVEPADVDSLDRIRRLDGVPLPSLEIRLATGARVSKATTTDQFESAVCGDLAASLCELLDAAEIPAGDGSTRRVEPSDIAVLVHSNKQAELIQTTLLAAGIPAVLSRGGSVLESPAAEQWRWLLDALRRPSDLRSTRTFALSWFSPHDLRWLADADDDAMTGLQDQVHRWAQTLRDHGVGELLRSVTSESGVTARLLGRPGGDRDLTDLHHIAELLGAGVDQGPANADALLAVLDAPAVEAIDAEIDRDVLARRIESESDAVQVMTTWVAKGLEFPVVCYPMGWRKRSATDVVFHEDPTTRVYDVMRAHPWGSTKADKDAAKERKDLAAAERLGEDFRLLYVALTRAAHHCRIWWAPGRDAYGTALTRVLFARGADGAIDPARYNALAPKKSDVDWSAARLEPLVAAGAGTISVRDFDVVAEPPLWVPSAGGASDALLGVAELNRSLPRSDQRWSFTAITAYDAEPHDYSADPTDVSGGDRGAGDEGGSGDVGTVERPSDPDEVVVGGGTPSGAVDHLGGLPAGAAFGTLVHEILEQVDFAAPDLRAEVERWVDERLARTGFDLGAGADPTADPAAALTDGLVEVIRTPLLGVFRDRSLSGIGRADRLDEMSFELLLATSGEAVSMRDVGALVADHLAPSLFDDPTLYEWAVSLAEGRIAADLDGHLTGSIDAVLRVPGTEGAEPSYVVVDYKTNKLGSSASTEAYGRASLAQAMAEHHYPLQALLYSVALHRYLRWRQPGYDPQVHLGGVAYLFVRGMVGESTPVVDGHPDGVFAWVPPAPLVVQLSDLIDGRRP